MLVTDPHPERITSHFRLSNAGQLNHQHLPTLVWCRNKTQNFCRTPYDQNPVEHSLFKLADLSQLSRLVHKDGFERTRQRLGNESSLVTDELLFSTPSVSVSVRRDNTQARTHRSPRSWQTCVTVLEKLLLSAQESARTYPRLQILSNVNELCRRSRSRGKRADRNRWHMAMTSIHWINEWNIDRWLPFHHIALFLSASEAYPQLSVEPASAFSACDLCSHLICELGGYSLAASSFPDNEFCICRDTMV